MTCFYEVSEVANFHHRNKDSLFSGNNRI